MTLLRSLPLSGLRRPFSASLHCRLRVVDAPLRRIPEADRGRVGLVDLLDPRPTADALNGGVRDASVLVGFAEEVLAVDELQGTAPQRAELDAQPLQFSLLVLRDPTNNV